MNVARVSWVDTVPWLVRGAGIAVILFLVTRGPCDPTCWMRAMAFVALTFAWLFATGGFGLAGLCADDRRIAPVVALALFVRLFLVRLGNSEIRVYVPTTTFAGGWLVDKHSVLYDAWMAVFMSLWGPSRPAFMLVNAVVGALAVVPLYLFVSRRFEDRLAGCMAAIVFSVHPLIARYAATDAHYSMILFFFFSGLAFLADVRGWRELFAGLVCLGIAAALRIEGAAYVGLALLLPRWRPIITLIRRDRRMQLATLSGLCLLSALTLGNFAWKRSEWGAELNDSLDWVTRLTSAFHGPFRMWSFGPLLDLTHAGDGLILALFWLGVAAAILGRRFRAGLLVVAAAVILTKFVLRADSPIRSVEHRFNVVWALQTVVAGIGMGWLSELVPAWRKLLAVGLAAGVIVIVLASHARELRHPYEFNTEYELVEGYVEAAKSSGPCRLLYFNDGDMGLNNPGDIVLGVKAVNCADEDCAAQVSQGGCLYVLKGIGCNSVGTAPERRQGRALKDDCEALVSTLNVKRLDERQVSFREAYGDPAPPGKFPSSGVVGIYEVLGTR